MTPYRFWLLTLRRLCEWRELRCLMAARQWQERRMAVLAALATSDEDEIQMWDRQ